MDKFTGLIVIAIFMVFLIIVCVWVIVRGIRKRSREEDNLRNLAERLGFSYTERDDDLSIIKLLDDPASRSIFIEPPIMLFKQNKFAYDIMRGKRANLDVWIFNWTYLTDGRTGTAPQTEALTVVVLQDKNNPEKPFAYYEPGRFIESGEIENFLDEAIYEYQRIVS